MNAFLVFKTPRLAESYEKELNKRFQLNYPVFKWITIAMMVVETILFVSYSYINNGTIAFTIGSGVFNAVILFDLTMFSAYTNIAIVKFPSVQKYAKIWEFFIMLLMTTFSILQYYNNLVSIPKSSVPPGLTLILLALDFSWKVFYAINIFRLWYWRCGFLIGTMTYFIVNLSFLYTDNPTYTIIRGMMGVVFLVMLVYSAERTKRFSFMESFRLEEQDKTFRAILNLIPESILILDNGGKVKYANKFMKSMIGVQHPSEENSLADHTEMFARFTDFRIPKHMAERFMELKMVDIKARTDVSDTRYTSLPSNNHQTYLDIESKPSSEENIIILESKKGDSITTHVFNNASKLRTNPTSRTIDNTNNTETANNTNSNRTRTQSTYVNTTNPDTDTKYDNPSAQINRPTSPSVLPRSFELQSFAQLIQHLSAHFHYLKSNYTLLSKYENFLTFYGKFQENPDTARKSIELKLSIAEFDKEDCFIAVFRDTTERDLIALYENNSTYKDNLLASVSHELRTPLNGNLTFLECAILAAEIPKKFKEKYLEPALTSGKMLYHLINDILDLSQINVNQLQLQLAKMNLVDVTEYCRSLVKFQAEFKKEPIAVETCYDQTLPKNIISDPNRLKQILLNLLTNALKYTYHGKIILRVKKEQDWIKFEVEDSGIGINKEELMRLRKNLDLTSRSDIDKVNKRSTGVGLGLSISNALAKYLGPEEKLGINVFSIEGTGSVFSFVIKDMKHACLSSPIYHEEDNFGLLKDEIPRRKQMLGNMETRIVVSSPLANDAESLPKMRFSSFHKSGKIDVRDDSIEDLDEHMRDGEQDQVDMSRGVHPKSTSFMKYDLTSVNASKMSGLRSAIVEKCTCPEILVVDDDGFNIKAMEYLLGALGKTFVSVYNGQEAIDKVMERNKKKCGKECRQFQLIVMDCNMPVMDGFDATKELREKMKEGQLEYIGIVACTSYVGKGMVEKCLGSGMDECLSKPVNKEELRAVVARYVKKGRKEENGNS